MGKVLVRLTIRDEPFEVDEGELPGLRGQGLLAGEPDGDAGTDGDGTDAKPQQKQQGPARVAGQPANRDGASR